MPTSDKKIAANRANAKKSTGPKTPRGKSNSSRNGIRHGLLAGVILIEGESRERFLEVCKSFEAEYNPETATERALVASATAAGWRLSRLWAIESAGIVYEQQRQPRSEPGENPATQAMLAIRTRNDNSRHTELMMRYESLLDRQYHRAIDRLNQIRHDKEEKNARATRSQQSEQNQRHDRLAQPTGNPPESHPEPNR